jgi:hypothetical protein
VAEYPESAPRSIFAHPDEPTAEEYYDQIAWFETTRGASRHTLNYRTGGFAEFLPYVYGDTSLSKSAISYRISDHYPLRVEFGL